MPTRRLWGGGFSAFTPSRNPSDLTMKGYFNDETHP